ncbi:MAG: NAD(P)H-hydrate dehydratase [Oscillospiraceae bacterium]
MNGIYYATPHQMKDIERYSDEHGVSYRELMENAGAAAAELVCKLSSEYDLGGGVMILCGKGNNGGDGFVLARDLFSVGTTVYVVLTSGDPATELAGYEYCQLGECGIDVLDLNDNIDKVFSLFSSCSLIVDAVYGTGFHGELPPEIKACFSFAKRCKKPIVALDTPSGGNCLTGEAEEDVLQCDHTITFGCVKTGMLCEPLRSLCGRITVADIGFTEECFESVPYVAKQLDEEYVKSLFPKRAEDCYKNQFGHLFNVSGCGKMSGAAQMSTLAALRSGVGRLTLASTSEVTNRLAPFVFEATFLPLEAAKDGSVSAKAADTLINELKNATAVSVGSGLSHTKDTEAIVKAVIENTDCPVIIDADGINCVCSCIDIIRNTKGRLILTPHLGELKRLYAAAFDSNFPDRLTMAQKIAREFDVIVAAKGVPNYIVGNDRLFICRAGTPGLAKGGSGDVLAGIIGAFAAVGLAPSDAAAAGVFVHGKAADIARDKLSETGMLPRDVIEALPYVFKAWNR